MRPPSAPAWVCLLLLLLAAGLGPTGAEEMDGDTDRDEERGRRMMPYWNLWSSDFFGWVEELRAQAAYDRIEDLARTFWAHFPIANELKLDVPDSDPPPEE